MTNSTVRGVPSGWHPGIATHKSLINKYSGSARSFGNKLYYDREQQQPAVSRLTQTHHVHLIHISGATEFLLTLKLVPTSVRRGGHCAMVPPQTLKIKKCINSTRIFRCKCVILGVICVFLGVILQNFPGGMPPDPFGMVVLKLICDVTRL